MDSENLSLRLSRISTIWPMVGKLDQPQADAGYDARLALIKRYQGAAYRYLLGIVRDVDAADELFQQFALRVVQGAFRHADPGRGRFRDYLKTALIHLVSDYRRRQRQQALPLDSAVAEQQGASEDPASDEAFLSSWRNELLARAWAALEQRQRQGGQPCYSVLRFRAEHPKASSTEMSERLNAELHPKSPFTEAGIRKILQRARERFADALIEEVAHSLGDPAFNELEQELIDLGLLGYCRLALERRRQLRA